MRCRCEDIAKCNRDIIKLQNAMGQASQVMSGMASADGMAQRVDNYENLAYLLDGGVRGGARGRRNTKRQLMQTQVSGGVSRLSMVLQRLQQELVSLRREDTLYHEEERRRQEEEARRQHEQRQAALKKMQAD